MINNTKYTAKDDHDELMKVLTNIVDNTNFIKIIWVKECNSHDHSLSLQAQYHTSFIKIDKLSK